MERLWGSNRVLSAAIVGTLLVLVSACGSSSSSSAAGSSVTPAHRGPANTLNWWGEYGDTWPDSLDPAVGSNTPAVNTMALIDANLVKLSYPSLKVVGDLAGSWKVSNGGKTYTFSIRPNARFNNGDAVTAGDVVFSLTRALLPATRSPVAGTYLGHIAGASSVLAGKAKTLSGVKALGARTVQITLDRPVAYFLTALSYPPGDVLDRKVMGDKPAGTYLTSACAGNVGAGPFRFVCRNGSNNLSSFYLNGHAPSMDMAPNPYYYGPKPTISIHAPVYTSSDAVFKAYGAGDLDGAVVPSADLSAAKGMKGYMNVTQFQTDHVTVNVQIPPFDNIHCRLAVAYAIDRQGIARTTLNGTETPIYDVLPPGILGYFGREPDVPYYDPGRAKMEIARCPGGLKNLTLTVQNSSPDIIHEYDAVRANLQAIGASVTIKPVSVTSWLNIVTQNLSATKTRITEDLWIDDFPDPQDWLGTLLRSDSSDNISGFKSAQFDSLIQRADVEQNPARRAALYRDAQKIALRGGDWIAVGAQNGVYVIPPRVHGFVAANGGTWPVNNDWSKVSMSSG